MQKCIKYFFGVKFWGIFARNFFMKKRFYEKTFFMKKLFNEKTFL